MDEIKIKIDDVFRVVAVLNDLQQVNEQPYLGHIKRKLYQLQPELEYIQEADQEDIEAIEDNEISLGQPMPCPPSFLSQHREVLEMLCENVEKKKSQIEQLVKDE